MSRMSPTKVVEVTDDHNGIVMDSIVTDGEEGRAGASFSLLIPFGPGRVGGG